MHLGSTFAYINFIKTQLKSIYLFTSERLGFRNWSEDDLQEFAEMNADPEVMEHFPNTLTKNESKEFIQRLQKHYKDYGYNYFATEVLETGELIGFIGLAHQQYTSEFTPAVDIGWRLKKSAWKKGYATEGAKRCLTYAFDTLKIARVISTFTINNLKSENVMKKIGMTKLGEFKHPKLKGYPKFEKCFCYEIRKPN